MVVKLCLIGLILAGSLSCGSSTNEDAVIMKAVGKYNQALVIAYRNVDFGPLGGAASEKAAKKVRVIVNSYLGGNQVMESDVKRIDFKDVKVEGDRAIARTSEDWTYRWVDFKTGEEVEPLKDIHYEMLYHLEKIDDKWLVDKVEKVGNGAGRGEERGV
jgi:hypothetical protein